MLGSGRPIVSVTDRLCAGGVSLRNQQPDVAHRNDLMLYARGLMIVVDRIAALTS